MTSLTSRYLEVKTWLLLDIMRQVKNCWEMQQCDCHGEKKEKNTKKQL
jgi:hypothetical protein